MHHALARRLRRAARSRRQARTDRPSASRAPDRAARLRASPASTPSCRRKSRPSSCARARARAAAAAEAPLGFLLQKPDAAIERDRVEAAGEDDARAAVLGVACRTCAIICRHPVRLAAEIDIVRAGLRAGGQQRLAIELVGADRGDDDACAVGQRVERAGVGCVGVDQRQCPSARRSRCDTPRACRGRAPPWPSARRRRRRRSRSRYSATSRPVKPVAP